MAGQDPGTTGVPAVPVRGPARPAPRAWELWRAPRRVVALVLAVDALALLVSLPVVLTGLVGLGSRDALVLALLGAGTVVHTEAARWVERVREVDAEHRPYVDPKSMWSFAGLLLLPLAPALVLVALTWVYWALRVATVRLRPHRWVFSLSTALLASVAASVLLGLLPVGEVAGLSGPSALALVALAALVRWTVNHGLVCAVIRLSDPSVSWSRRFRSPTDTLLGLGALGAGIVLAAVAESTPWLVPVLIAPLLVMHRGFLLPQLARAARTDGKTGLVTATHWRTGAAAAVDRARRRRGALGVLMIDLDEFKTLNDAHGHLVGDRVLQAVAKTLAEEVAAADAVGRFGGEEFVVLLEGTDPDDVGVLAERLRRRIASLSVSATGPDGPVAVQDVTASIGTASYPHTATALEDLLLAADAALYAAKAAGRDRVRAAPARGALPR